MNDRESLELAAKAFGYKNYFSHHMGRYSFVTYEDKHYSIEKECHVVCEKTLDWNPLEDDGDALRLAVKLGIGVIQWTNGVSATNGPIGLECGEPWGSDPCAATRRAIVRAAAEIGKGIQPQTVEGVLEDNYYKSQAEAEELGRQMQEGGAA